MRDTQQGQTGGFRHEEGRAKRFLMWHYNMQGGRGGMEAGPAAAAGLVERLAPALLGEGPLLARALSADRRAFLQALALLQARPWLRAHIIWLVIGLYKKMWAHGVCSMRCICSHWPPVLH